LFNINAVLNIVGANTSSVKAAVSDINSEMDRGTRKARSFGDAVALKGANLSVFAVASTAVVKLTESISMATRDALRFESEMAKIAQTVGISTAEARKHGEEIRKLSVLYGLSAPKIAETVRVLGQAGYTLRQAKEAADSLAQTTLLSSFESITDTTDGLIAVNKQFIDTIGKSAQVLSLFNIVSKKYAVESADLVEVVRKAGGTFSATGGKLEELLAVFTTVRDTTRESAETISVGLRTIFTRLQRPKTIEYLQQFGIELVNLEGQFVGNFEAIQRIQRGLDAFGVRPGSIKFAEVVEEIGGVLQQSRVIPLLTQGAKLQQVYADAQSASSETAMDLAKAQDTLSFKIAQTQQNFAKLIGDIASSKGFDTLVRGVLSMTNAMIHFAAAIKDVLPLISALLAFNLAKSVGKLALGGPKAFLGRGFATGGFVPGSGNGDTVPAMLTPGEFVIRKSAAQAMGAEALHGINRYAKGGPVKGQDLGSAAIRKRVVSQKSQNEEFTTGQKINATDSMHFTKVPMGIDGGDLAPKAFEEYAASFLKQKFKGFSGVALAPGATDPLDLIGGPYPVEVRSRNKTTDDNELLDKLFRWRLRTKGNLVENTSKAGESLTVPGKVGIIYNNSKLSKQQQKAAKVRNVGSKPPQKKALGGGVAGTDTVPSLLTPGEFVVNKKSAQAFGYGNLHKVNKYASGGVVGVQRFASGGAVGGAILPGLEGLGDLAIVVNQLIPALSSATASFAKMSVAASITSSGLSGILNAGKGVSDFFTAYKAESKRLSDVRDAEIKGYQDAVAAQAKTTAELAAARAPLIAAPVANNADDINAAEKAAILSISRPTTTKAPVLDQKGTMDAQDKLQGAIRRLTIQYGVGSEEVKRATAIERTFIDAKTGVISNIKDQSDAVVKYTELVSRGNVVQQKLIDTLEEREAAEAKATAEAEAKINTGGIRERIGAGFRGLAEKGDAGDARRAKVQAGIEKAQMAITIAAAYFASSARSAAQALDKLANSAIEAGDAQGAYNNTIAASEKEAQGSEIDKGASGGVAIGGFLGLAVGGIVGILFPPLLPLVSLFGALGAALGTGIGALLGFFGAVDHITDGLGLTDPAARQMEVERKASAAQKSANIKDVEKTTSDSITKSNNLRQFNPNAANDELVKGFDKFKNSSAAQQLGNPATQEQSKQFYDQLASAFEQLRTLPQNAGKGFDQLKRENFGLVNALERSSASLADNEQVLQGLRANTDAVSTAVTRERQAKLASINLQLRQVAIQKQVNTTLANMDSVIRSQTEGLMKFGIALGEDYSSQDIGVDLTDLSSRNTANPEYAAGLNAVYSMGGQSAEQAATLGRAIPLLNNLENSLINQGSAEIRQSFQAAGVSPETSRDIFNAIEKARNAATPDDPFDPIAVKQEVIGILKPFADNSEDKRKAINTQLQNQLSLVKKQSELQKKQLEYRLAGLDAEREIADTVARVRGEEADPRAARAERLKRTGTILQGTELRGADLAGDKTDIDKISAALVKAELRKQRIVDERKTATASGNTNEVLSLDQEMVGLIEQTELLGQAMSSLADVSKENAAIEAKIAKNQEKRAVVREAASNLAFGSNQDRKDFFRTLNQARGVAAFGTADVLRDKDKGNVFSFLKQMKDIPAFGGKTGQEVIDATTRNFLRRGGVSQQKVEEIMAKMIPSEEQALALMKDNVGIDQQRNEKLDKVIEILSRQLFQFSRPQAAIAQPGKVPLLVAKGGPINVGPQFAPKGTDTVPAMLTPGEFVVNAKDSNKNMGVLTAINSGRTAYLSDGTKKEKEPSPAQAALLDSLRGQTIANKQAEQKKQNELRAKIKAQTEEAKNGPSFNASVSSETNERIIDIRKRGEDLMRDSAAKKEAEQEALFNSRGVAGGSIEAGQFARQNLAVSGGSSNMNKELAWQANRYSTFLTAFDERLTPDMKLEAAKKGQKNRERLVKDTTGLGNRFKSGGALEKYYDSGKSSYEQEFEQQRNQSTTGIAGNMAMAEARQQDLAKSAKIKAKDAARKANYVPTAKDLRRDEIRKKGEASGRAAKELAKKGTNEVGLITYGQQKAAAIEREKDRAAASAKQKMLKEKNSPEYFAYKADLDAKREIKESKGPSVSTKPEPIREGGPTYSERQKAFRERTQQKRRNASIPQIPNIQENNSQSSPVAMGGSVRPNSGQVSQAQGGLDFSKLFDSLKTFGTQFDASVMKLVEMPKTFDIKLESQGVNVNLNSAEFLAKLPDILKTTILEQIQSQLGSITNQVKQSLSTGT